MADAHANFSYSTVATAPSPATSGTSLVVTAGQGALFPAVPFNAVIWPTGAQPLSTNAEIVRVTAISTDTLTITRSQESTSARTVVVGDQISAAVTKLTLTDIEKSLKVSTKSATYGIVASDCGSLIQMTGNSAANLALTCASSAATLGSGFYFYLEHAGTGTSGANKKLVFTPTTSTIDGAASITTYPGDLRIITSDGTNWNSKLLRGGFIDIAVADSVFTLTIPTGFTTARADVWGSGGSGGGGTGAAAGSVRGGGGGGGGAACSTRWFNAADLGSSITCTVAAGAGTTSAGADGSVGNNSTFGSLVTGYGGGGGSNFTTAGAGGGGAGQGAVGASSTNSAAASGGGAFGLTGGTAGAASLIGGGGGPAPASTGPAGGSSFPGGGGGGGGSSDGTTAGGDGGGSTFGAGGGGAGGGVNAASPGTARNGGAGGAVGLSVTTSGGGGTGGVVGGTLAGQTASQTDSQLGGAGGGGGGASATTTGGAGGTGTVPGGGGGGGGGGTSTGGAGGNGGAGAIRFWYFP